MTLFRIRFDRGLAHWIISNVESGHSVVTPRLVLDAPAKSEGSVLISAGHLRVEDTLAKLGDHKPPLGVVNERGMNEWCVVFDQTSGRWVIYRHDRPSVSVTTKNLELDCHGITSEGILHCLAEMLVRGRTNRDASFQEADRVKLRTLRVFDQKVNVKPILVRPAAKSPIPGR